MGEEKYAGQPQQKTPKETPPAAPPRADPPQVPQNQTVNLNSEPEPKDGDHEDEPKKSSTISDKVMVFATCVIAVGTLVSAGAIVMQWQEMVGGGTQTDKIIAAANAIKADQDQLVLDNKQVLADNRQALAKVLQENREELASALKQNRDALQAQTAAAHGELAAIQKQTEVTAETAKEALHVSERAYVLVGLPTIDITTKFISLPIVNTGRIPSGKVRGIIHEATIDGADPTTPSRQIPPTEAHWKHYELEYVPTTGGQVMSFTVPVPALNAENLNNSHQQIVVVGILTYNDGFTDDAEELWPFCYGSAMLPQSKTLQWIVCDSSLYLPEAIEADHYPNNEY
jgi:hypothetical protein